ncbi:N-succinyl-L,L-diaminopimelate aminotransferase alternative [Halorhodospira halochloris]|uniref:N-succinyl-L,L-diaminopimelate aminotransferase alternative n=1 Tax=Halorhodospira halochloris TaxID=1052 RepID=A0A110B4Y6_HALHR|nr:succinyldiaminopimelate transaminase [Halorhodospira halochloris]MBK1651174.1 succinyldiaminopimelate transaminase [Halorhodospira halochloris]BAU57446.1 N-succinyl-L,L-diaminopimelate aminotransferase alternative [Halorhodospira halochloris]
MNRGLPFLQPYPFERMERLKAGARPQSSAAHINLGIGEPQEPVPEFITQALRSNIEDIGQYPATRGTEQLRQSISEWLISRFALPQHAINAGEHVLPVAGTREALFAIAQTVIGRGRPYVALPNPFYQIYEGAALLSGAKPRYLRVDPQIGLPDPDSLDKSVWNRVQLLYITNPANPTGAIADAQYLQRLLELSERHGFIIAADECYSEIYTYADAPPISLLSACIDAGRHDFERCMVFHSLSKRSSVPGLRSGFVAGDPGLIYAFLRYRTYQGCALPLHVQKASSLAWQDEAHVRATRQRYVERLQAVTAILSEVLDDIQTPSATFYLWPRTPIDDQEFTRKLWEQEQVTVLPGSFLSRTNEGDNPGLNRIRMALVPDFDTCIDAAERIKRFVDNGI